MLCFDFGRTDPCWLEGGQSPRGGVPLDYLWEREGVLSLIHVLGIAIRLLLGLMVEGAVNIDLSAVPQVLPGFPLLFTLTFAYFKWPPLVQNESAFLYPLNQVWCSIRLLSIRSSPLQTPKVLLNTGKLEVVFCVPILQGVVGWEFGGCRPMAHEVGLLLSLCLEFEFFLSFHGIINYGSCISKVILQIGH